MRLTTLPLALLLSLGSSMAQAKVDIHINIGLPVVPPLVTVQPGIQVVEGFPEEVFLHDGWYWCRRPDGWYRARSPRDRFDWINARRVPGRLRREPMGHYRNWHHEEGNRPGPGYGGQGGPQWGPGHAGPGRPGDGRPGQHGPRPGQGRPQFPPPPQP